MLTFFKKIIHTHTHTHPPERERERQRERESERDRMNQKKYDEQPSRYLGQAFG